MKIDSSIWNQQMQSGIKLALFGSMGIGLAACSGLGNGITPPPASKQDSPAITKFTITSKESPAFGGAVYGPAGQYEIIKGIAEGELDPADPKNAIITDLDLAPRNSNGKVTYKTTFSMAKPIDMAKSNGVLLHTISNRGRNEPTPSPDGTVSMIVGWQADITDPTQHRVTEAPIAKNKDGSEITGVVLARMADMPKGTTTMTLRVLAREVPYDAVMDQTKARLIRKASETREGKIGATKEIPTSDWRFADCSKTPFPGIPDPRKLCIKGGFDPAYLYEMTYQAKNPTVLGVGLAAIRDVNSFFRYETVDANGNVNPLAGKIKKSINFGTSQSGNTLKTSLLLGFNDDLQGRMVFDGAIPHVAGRFTTINVRFGLPSGSGTLYEPGGEGVLWWDTYADKVRKDRAPAGILDRCKKSNSCPKIFDLTGSAEFVGRLTTVALTGTDGKADLPLPENVRRYYFPGTTHGGGNGGISAIQAPAGACVLAANPNPERDQIDALVLAMKEWIVDGREPPASAYPTLKDKTLAPATAAGTGFPKIPGVPSMDGLAFGLMEYDFGDKFNYNDFSGVITVQPPAIRKIIPAMMPVVDADGNETSGVPSVLHQAPLGTYTGWNPTKSGFFKGQACGGGLNGGFIPFKSTRAERVASGDPRPSLEERYGTQAGYVCAVTRATHNEVNKRFLLQSSADKLISQAKKSNILPAKASTAEAIRVTQKLCEGIN